MPVLKIAKEDEPFHCIKDKDKLNGARLVRMITVKSHCIDGGCPFFSQYHNGKLICTFNELAKEKE